MNASRSAAVKKIKAGNSSDSRSIDYGMLPDLLGYQLRLAQLAIFQDFAEGMGEHQMTPSLYGVLVVISANPGLKQSELASAVRLDRSTMVSVIDKLEKRNLVTRKQVPGDRRSNSIQLTADGMRLLEQIQPLVASHEQRLCAELTGAEQETLFRLLGKIFPDRR